MKTQSKITLTNVRTHLQFNQYGNVVEITYNGNKLQAMNAIRYARGVKQFTALTEYRVTNYLPEGQYTTNETADTAKGKANQAQTRTK